MKKLISVFLIVVLTVSLVSCNNNTSDLKKVYAANISENVISANNKFAFDLFSEINTTDSDKNVFISPYSISSVLSMLYNGADNNTKSELSNSMYYKSIDDETLNNNMMYVREHLNSLDKDVNLDIANSIWIRDSFKVNDEYISQSKFVFDAYVTDIDMSKDSAAKTINDYINKKTNNMIGEVIKSPIPADVVMYLVNTIFFDGKWETPFDPKLTYDSNFKNNDTTTSAISMMNLKSDFFYGETNREQIIEIPYGEGEVSMFVILPSTDTDINEYIANLDYKKWEDLRYNILEDHKEEVSLMLPKFKIEYGVKNLNDELKQLGINEIFTGNADLSKIANNIFLSRVLHKAVIEVDETGTIAAAATVGEVTLTAMPMDPKKFITDRPFIYLIVDNTDETILFMGKTLNLQ